MYAVIILKMVVKFSTFVGNITYRIICDILLAPTYKNLSLKSCEQASRMQ